MATANELSAELLIPASVATADDISVAIAELDLKSEIAVVNSPDVTKPAKDTVISLNPCLDKIKS